MDTTKETGKTGDIDLASAFRMAASTLPPAEQHAAFQVVKLMLDAVERDALQEEANRVFLGAWHKMTTNERASVRMFLRALLRFAPPELPAPSIA